MVIIRLKRYEFFMFSISLKMIFRSWARNKIYFVISMLSLIIGLTCSVLLIGFVANEYNIAHVVKGGGQWYLLQEQNVYYMVSALHPHSPPGRTIHPVQVRIRR